jgi:hypothetical protein
MSTFDDPLTGATEARAVLRGLAHATRRVKDPRELYAILGDLSLAAASLGQTLHQLAAVHDRPPRKAAWVPDGSRTTRTAAYQVSWDLHRAGEMLKTISSCIDDAHQAEGTIVYQPHDFPRLVDATRTTPNCGLEL